MNKEKEESKEKKQLILRELNAMGLTYESIGEALGVTKQAVEQMISSNYVSMFRYKPKKIGNNNIISFLAKSRGLSVSALSKECGISLATLVNKLYSNPLPNGRTAYFNVGQASAVSKFFGQELDVLFEKAEIPMIQKGRPKKLNTND